MVCLLRSRALQKAEQIEILFGMWTLVGLGNHVLDGGPEPAMKRGSFRGRQRGGAL